MVLATCVYRVSTSLSHSIMCTGRSQQETKKKHHVTVMNEIGSIKWWTCKNWHNSCKLCTEQNSIEFLFYMSKHHVSSTIVINSPMPANICKDKFISFGPRSLYIFGAVHHLDLLRATPKHRQIHVINLTRFRCFCFSSQTGNENIGRNPRPWYWYVLMGG